jgi:phage terminase large subunit-like protein/intein/homing endonuclease
MGKSLMEELALMPEDERAAVLAGVDMDALMWEWSAWARPEQRPPDGFDWGIWLYLAGRGSGKTRSAGEWIRDKAKYTNEGLLRFALVARTAADVRDVIVEGEALALDTLIPTPTGFTQMGDLRPGDHVLGADGLPTRILWCSEVSTDRPCYRVTFSDGSEIIADENHKWPTQYISPYRDGRTPELVRTTGDMSRIVLRGKTGQRHMWVNAASPLELSDADLPIPPYTLGVWLGDGHTYHAAVTTMDPEVLEGITNDGFRVRQHGTGGNRHINNALTAEQEDDVRRQLKDAPRGTAARLARELGVTPATITHISKRANSQRVYKEDLSHGEARTWGILGLDRLLKDNDLLGNKHIPDAYLRASYNQRLALLRGLIDTDGTVSKRGQVEFSNTNLDLIYAVRELCSTLGIKSSITKRGTKKAEHHKDGYRLRFTTTGVPVATIKRKVDRILAKSPSPGNFRHFISSVEPVESVPVRCIAVDNEDHLYLAGKTMIPTHNSGIINISPPSERPHYEPSKRRLTWPNGNTATLFTADEPDGLRGPQAHYSWADELAAWRQTPDAAGMTSWDNLRVATRLGPHPQIIATTTPKRVPLLYALIEEADRTGRVIISKGTTMDNSGNLSEAYLDAIFGVYKGTRLARQELYGEMLDDVEGALWMLAMIEESRQGVLPPSAPLRIIGVDPSVAENPRDECGIVVCASTADRDLYKRHAWVMEDASILGSPEVWATKVVEMARRWGAPVVAEVNQGGALVRNAINSIDPTIKVFEVHSKYGKALRAEPIVLAYEQRRVHHIGYMADLESQMLSWIPGETSKSPDRVDALVHAMTALLIKPPPGFVGGKLTAKSMAGRRIQTERRTVPISRGRGGGRIFTVR